LGGGYIPGCEKRSHAGKAIRMWRFDIVANTNDPEIGPSVIIGEDDNDVRSLKYSLSD